MAVPPRRDCPFPAPPPNGRRPNNVLSATESVAGIPAAAAAAECHEYGYDIAVAAAGIAAAIAQAAAAHK